MRRLLQIASGLLLALIGILLYVERGQLMRRSTLRLLNESRKLHLHGGSFMHAFIYARWPREYIGTALKYSAPRMSTESRQGAANAYHGKVLPIKLAKRLVSVQRDIPNHDVERILPYPLARDFVLKGPPEIVAFDCPCRGTREHPCQPIQVCMIVGQPFVDFILEHHPTKSRRLTTSEAVQLLEDEHRRGHLHAAYFKDVMLGRFYAICNCCKCCCGAVEVMNRHAIPMITPSGFVAQVDPDACAACGTCEQACAFDAIHVEDHAQVDWQKCMGCGVCEGQCPNNAISLVRDERKGVPLDVERMYS